LGLFLNEMSLLEKIKMLSKSHSGEIIELRRHLHANPELSYQEFNTAKFVAKKLRDYGKGEKSR
jgi:metal-dependent amidase/aminoacylase/carboxypeptidase family protein